MQLIETERLSINIYDYFGNHTIFNDIILKNFDIHVGNIILESNGWIGYEIFEEYRRNGYAKEALIACRDYLLRSGVDPYLEIDGRNTNSQKTAKSCGFSCEEPYNEYGCDVWQYKKIVRS